MSIDDECQQAGQFLAYHAKRSRDFAQDFVTWADSKDFGPDDRLRIWLRSVTLIRLTQSEQQPAATDVAA
jgi:hypothetical protein